MVSVSSKTYVDKWGMLCFDVKVTEENGSVTEKRLSASDYLKLFQDSVIKEKNFVAIPRLPKEVIWAAAEANEPDSFKAVILLPEAVRPVFYCKQIINAVPFPALCACVQVEGGRHVNTKLFAVKRLEEDAELYRYPFGNVGVNDGRCCFGNIVVEGIRNAEEALKVTDAFLMGETNNDLWRSLGGYHSQGDLLEALCGKKRFPKSLLKKCGGTVRNLCCV